MEKVSEVEKQSIVVCERTERLNELDEQTITAILTLHIESGVSLEQLEKAYPLGLPLLKFLLSPPCEVEEGYL